MSQALVGILSRLATDPVLYDEFRRNPEALMVDAGLSSAESSAVKAGKAGELISLLGRLASVGGVSAPGSFNLVASDSAPVMAYFDSPSDPEDGPEESPSEAAPVMAYYTSEPEPEVLPASEPSGTPAEPSSTPPAGEA